VSADLTDFFSDVFLLTCDVKFSYREMLPAKIFAFCRRCPEVSEGALKSFWEWSSEDEKFSGAIRVKS
jgi:hypothetical protein